MKINSSNSSLPLTPSTDAKVRTPAATPATTAPAATETAASTVQLSSVGSSASSSSAPVNAAKVAEIKKAISEGRFQVNSGAVADSLLKSVSDLISSQQA